MNRVPIGDLVQPVTTWSPASDPDREFDYIDIAAVDRDTKSVSEPTRVTGSSAPSRARQLVRDHDVLVSTVRPNLNAVAVVPGDLDGATASTGFCVLRAGPTLSPRYLYQWVRSNEFVSQMTRLATGASYPAVTDAIILDSRIPLPPLDEQRRIAAILDQADALRAKRQAASDAVTRIKLACFDERFGRIQN